MQNRADLADCIAAIKKMHGHYSYLEQEIDTAENNWLIYRSCMQSDDLSVNQQYRHHCRLYGLVLSKFIACVLERGISERYRTLIRRAIDHLYAGDIDENTEIPQLSGTQFKLYISPAWKIAAHGDEALVRFFLSKKIDYARLTDKKFLHAYAGDGLCEFYDVYCDDWSLLLEAALHNKNEMVVQLIAGQYPEVIPQVLSKLASLFRDAQSHQMHDMPYLFSPDSIIAARIRVLLALRKGIHDAHLISYQDKRLVEKYLIHEVTKSECLDQLVSLYDACKKSLCVSQHRHYDFVKMKVALFKLPAVPYPTSRKNFILALQKRAYEILAERFDGAGVMTVLQGIMLPFHDQKGVTAEWRQKTYALMQAENALPLAFQAS